MALVLVEYVTDELIFEVQGSPESSATKVVLDIGVTVDGTSLYTLPVDVLALGPRTLLIVTYTSPLWSVPMPLIKPVKLACIALATANSWVGHIWLSFGSMHLAHDGSILTFQPDGGDATSSVPLPVPPKLSAK